MSGWLALAGAATFLDYMGQQQQNAESQRRWEAQFAMSKEQLAEDKKRYAGQTTAYMNTFGESWENQATFFENMTEEQVTQFGFEQQHKQFSQAKKNLATSAARRGLDPSAMTAMEMKLELDNVDKMMNIKEEGKMGLAAARQNFLNSSVNYRGDVNYDDDPTNDTTEPEKEEDTSGSSGSSSNNNNDRGDGRGNGNDRGDGRGNGNNGPTGDGGSSRGEGGGSNRGRGDGGRGNSESGQGNGSNRGRGDGDNGYN